MGELKGWASLTAAVMVIALFLRLTSSGNSNVYDDVTRAIFFVSLALLLVLGAMLYLK